MKKFGLFLILIGYSLSCPATSDTYYGKGKVKIEKDSNVSLLTPIAFGNIITYGKAGNVTMQSTQTGSLSGTNNNFIIDQNGTSGSFKIIGDTGDTVYLTIPTKTSLIALSDSTKELTFYPALSSTNITISANESDNIVYAGGTLEIPKDSADGKYLGTVKLTLSY